MAEWAAEIRQKRTICVSATGTGAAEHRPPLRLGARWVAWHFAVRAMLVNSARRFALSVFVPAVLLAAGIGGLGPGLLATA